MSLRDFNTPTETSPYAGDPLIRSVSEPASADGLGTFHTINPEDREPNHTPKIVGALAVALMMGGVGVYAYTATGKNPQPVVQAANTQPATPAPAMAPPPVQTADATPAALDPATNAPEAAAADNAAPVKETMPQPQKSASTAAPARMAAATPSATPSADVTPSQPASASGAATRLAAADAPAAPVEQQAQQQAITPAPIAPSPNDVASVNGPSQTAISPNATSAQDMPTPQQSPDPSATTPAAPSQAGETQQPAPVQ